MNAAEALRFLTALSPRAQEIPTGNLGVRSIELVGDPASPPLLRAHRRLRIVATAEDRVTERTFLWDVLASSEGVELLTGTPATLARAFARERLAVGPDSDARELASLLGETMRLNVDPHGGFAAPVEGVFGIDDVDPFVKRNPDDGAREPLDPAAWSTLEASLRPPRWENGQLYFARVDVVQPDFRRMLILVRELAFAFPGPGLVDLTVDRTLGLVEAGIVSPRTAPPAPQPPSPQADALPPPAPKAIARLESRWAWLGPRVTERGAGRIAYRVAGAKPLPDRGVYRAGSALVTSWRQRLDGPPQAPKELEAQAFACDAGHARGPDEELRSIWMWQAMPLHLFLMVTVGKASGFGQDSRSFDAILGPLGLVRLTHAPENLAAVVTMEPIGVIVGDGDGSAQKLLLAHALDGALTPLGLRPYDHDSGLLDVRDLERMDKNDNDWAFAAKDPAVWKRLRPHVGPPRVFESSGKLRVEFVQIASVEDGEQRPQFDCLVDFDRHELTIDRATGDIEGTITVLASMEARMPSHPVIGRPFVVADRCVVAPSSDRDDWSSGSS